MITSRRTLERAYRMGMFGRASSSPTLSYDTPQTWYDYFTSVNLTPTTTGATSFAVQSGSLPAGVSLNTSTGAITGTPTALKTAGDVVIRATGPGGTADATINVTVLSMLLWPQNNGGPSLVAGYDTAVGFSSIKAASDGSGGEAADTDPAGYMADLSGNANTVIQATSGAKPTVANAGLNSKRCLTFDGGDFIRRAAFVGGAATQPVTLGVVGSLGSTAGGGGFLAFLDGASLFEHILYSGGTDQYTLYAGANVASGDATDTSPHLLVGVTNGASSKIYLDNTEIGSGDAGAQSMSGITIGANAIGTSNLPAGSKVSTAFAYDGSLDATALANLRTWATAKWGTP